MGSVGEIGGGDEAVRYVDETIFVAVAEDVERSKTTVLWAARNFSGKRICLIHVHRPAPPSPPWDKKLKQPSVKVIENGGRQEVDELMDSYLRLLSESEVRTDKLWIARPSIEEGIVELITQHKMKWFVMGAASDEHYSWKMTDLKSKKAMFACQRAPVSCHIWFLCKGYLIFTRSKNGDGANGETMPPLLQRVSDTETRRSGNLESSYMMRRLRYWRSLLEQGEFEKETRDSTRRFSSGSSSDVGREPVGSDSAAKLTDESKALERLCVKEMTRRKKLEEMLGKEREEVRKVKDQHDEFMKELENQIRKIRDMEKEYEERFVTAMGIFKRFEQKRDERRIEHGRPAKRLSENRRLEYSFMELNEATNEFDSSCKLGQGKYGSIYKGYIQHLQVAVKMLPSHGNHSEFQHQVEIISRARHPNLVMFMGACTESRSLIYQYIENGSLEDRLSSGQGIPPLSWENRIRIASEICSALLFLHSNMPCIIHGNLKPSKILLDSNLVTKISSNGISQLIPRFNSDKSVHTDPNFSVSGRLTPELDVYSFGIILLQLLTRRPVSGILRDVKCALENGNFCAVLDSSAGEWPVGLARKLANAAMRCCKKNPLSRPDLSVVLRVIDRMRVPRVPPSPSWSNRKAATRRAPSHFVCPIFQELMKDPLIAADGFTYEAEAIRKWLANGHDTSPMTNLKMEGCNLIPNHALHQAIQHWQNQW